MLKDRSHPDPEPDMVAAARKAQSNIDAKILNDAEHQLEDPNPDRDDDEDQPSPDRDEDEEEQ